MGLRGILQRIGLGSDKWRGWPERAYGRPHYQKRLETVQSYLAECLDLAPPGPLRVISICAGDGRDLIGVLGAHPRRNDVEAWLVELNPESVELGKKHAATFNLESQLNFIQADATVFEVYRDIAPADVVIVCGVWGHVLPEDRASLVRGLTSLCKPGGTVLWSRGLKDDEQRLTSIDSEFTNPPWEKVGSGFTPDNRWAVVIHRYAGPHVPLPENGQLFRFRRTSGN